MSELKPLWDKIDQHAEQIAHLSRENAALHARQQAMEERMDRMLQIMTEMRSESKAETVEIMGKLDDVNNSVNQAKGGLKLGGWIFLGVTSLIGLIIGVWKALGGSGGS